MSPDDRRTILVVDDDDVFRGRLVRALAERGFEARGAEGATSALALAAGDTPELAVVDLRMPDGSGLDVVRELHAMDPATKIVVLTGYLTKPADVDEILRAFEREKRAPEGSAAIDLAPSLARAEWEHIQRVLTDCGGNVSQAARVLGVHRRSLQRKLSKRPTPR
jgi:two-component system response regulator RegA